MKNLNTFFTVLILLCSSVTIAQTIFRGTVIDATTKQPIAQARVGISNQGIGEITNSKGSFNYRRYHEVLDSKSELVVGAPGYEVLRLNAEKLRSLFNISSKIELKPNPSSKKQKNKSVKDLTVFWDVSEDMKYRNIEEEIAYVQDYVSVYKNLTLHLVIFDDEIRSKEQIQVRDGDITRFRESLKGLTYKGVSNYDLLDIAGTDAVILSSNGKPIFGELEVSQEVPVNVVVSQKITNDLQYLRNLAAYTSGKFNLVNSKGLISDEQVTAFSEKSELVKGNISSLGISLEGASISIGNSLTEYISDVDGNFEIPAKSGDDIKFNYFRMFPKTIRIQNIDEFLKVEMTPKNDQLDEIILIGQKSDKVIVGGRNLKGEDGLMNATGDEYITSKDIPKNAERLEDILKESFPSVRHQFTSQGTVFTIGRMQVPFYVDATLVRGQLPFIEANDIESIIVKTNDIESNRYGPYVKGLAIFVTTKNNELSKAKYDPLVKGNNYNEQLAILPANTSGYDVSIKGKVVGPQGPIQGASIIKKGSFDEYFSDVNGDFAIPIKIGDVIVFSYLGMYSKGEVIGNLDQELLISLIPKNELLEEVVLKGNSKQKETIETAYGKEDKDKVGYAINSLLGKDIKPQHQFLSDVLRGQFAGIRVLGQGNNVKLIVRQGGLTLGGANGSGGPLFVVDNLLISDRSLSEMNALIDVQNIEKITILKSYASTNIYGSLAVDGAVIIKTRTGESTLSKENKATSLLVKGNDYQESDLQGEDANDELPSYIKEIQQIPAIDTRFERYVALTDVYETDIEFYVDMALYFKQYDSQKTQTILSDLTLRGKNNVKVLRTVAYIYESLEEFKRAQNVYERILKLEPDAAQSYRDVAMIYQYTGLYDKALELYVNMLGEQIKGVDFSGLEKPLISELSRLIAKHKDKIDYERLPNQWLKSNFNIDIRMVIDWSDRSAPFEFQFVNPNKKYYKWVHDLEKNQARLESEQKQGFQTEEFIIDDAPSGEWLVNIQYLGLEEDYVLPPFMKYTIYKKFGTAEETRDVRVVKLFRQLNKVTLGKIVM